MPNSPVVKSSYEIQSFPRKKNKGTKKRNFKVAVKQPKQTKVGFLRSWLLPESFQYQNLRYKHPPEKGVYWYWFSLFIRERDVRLYGVCISCGREITVASAQAGHFMPAADCGRDLLFDELNVNAECPRCNAWDETHLLGYAEGLDKRYGPGTAQKLRERREKHKARQPVKDWKKEEYAQMIMALPSYQQFAG